MGLTSHESRELEFIGRQHELAVLAAALDDALSGRGQMVMLAGEPGIGKTRLAQELASRAESLGAQVMWGWCYEHAGAPPFWPYVQPIRTYAEAVDAATLSSLMGLGGPAIAEIVPELRAKLPDLGQLIAAEPEQARFRLFDSVTTFLKNLAQSQPLLFIVDDLHWADTSSLLMLEFLVREIATSPVMVLGTYRDAEVTASHPMSQTLGNLVRERHFRRVQLGGLNRQEVGEFVEGHKGVNLSGDILEMIHSRTEGNPLFVNEIVELIDPEQITENRAWADVIPDGVRDAIGSRLNRLSETCNKVLGAASVIGREFDLSLLRSLDSDIGADGVLAALDEALDAQVIEELPGAVGRYQFGHALIQQSLYGEMSSIRKLRVHASIGETLEQMHSSNLAEHAAELARHFAEAQSLLGPEKLAKYSLMAGERALAVHAPDEALIHYQRGLAAKEEQAIDGETAALLFGLGQAQAATIEWHQHNEAVATLEKALDYYAEAGEVAGAVEIAEFPLTTLAGIPSGAIQLISKAIALVKTDSPEAGRLLSRLGLATGQEEGDYQGAQAAFARAVAIAQETKDAALEMRTLAYAAQTDFFNLHWKESVEKARRAIELDHSSGELLARVVAHYSAASALHPLGDLEGTRLHAKEMLTASERLRDRFWLASAFSRNEIVSRLEGDWQSARNFSNRGLEVLSGDPRILSGRVVLEYEVGNYDQGRYYLEVLQEAMDRTEPGPTPLYAYSAIAFQLAARITGMTELLDDAERASSAVLSSQSANPLFAMRANAGLAITAALRGDTAMATKQYSLLSPEEGTMLSSGFAGVDRLLGLLSQTMGNIGQASAHFEDGLAFCRKAGYRPELAWTCYDYADMLLERNGEGDLTKAMLLLDEALAISSELGMRPLMERVSALQERAAAQPVQAPAYPGGLTQREVEVIRLVAAGKTDR